MPLSSTNSTYENSPVDKHHNSPVDKHHNSPTAEHHDLPANKHSHHVREHLKHFIAGIVSSGVDTLEDVARYNFTKFINGHQEFDSKQKQSLVDHGEKYFSNLETHLINKIKIWENKGSETSTNEVSSAKENSGDEFLDILKAAALSINPILTIGVGEVTKFLRSASKQIIKHRISDQELQQSLLDRTSEFWKDVEKGASGFLNNHMETLTSTLISTHENLDRATPIVELDDIDKHTEYVMNKPALLGDNDHSSQGLE